MGQFTYYGRNDQGEAVNGVIDRDNENDVVNYLLERNVTPVTIDKEEKKASVRSTFDKNIFSKKTVDPEQLIMFCRQMRTINKVGLPLIQGLSALSSSIDYGPLKECLIDIVRRLESGFTLSSAMNYHRSIFNNLFLGMVKVGESTGKLDDVFWQMSIYISRDMETKKAMSSALRYPTFVLVAMIVGLFVVNLMVIPAFADMFNRFDAELPLATKILLSTSEFFINFWWLISSFLVAVYVGFYFWIKTPKGKYIWHRSKLLIPIFGPLIKKGAMSRYVRSFSLMVSSGLPMNKAISLCSEVVDNAFLSKKIIKIKEDIERGDSIHRTHLRSKMFSPLILQMINIGESSGQIDSLLIEVAESYEREVDYDLQSLSAKIEPILILIMAVFVVVLALGIFLPMWEMFNVQR